MRFHSSILAVSICVACACAETHHQSPLDQFKQQALAWYGRLSTFLPKPDGTPLRKAATFATGQNYEQLDIANWESTIRSSSSSTGAQEWWILMSGGNKTCGGRCGDVEEAFNRSAYAKPGAHFSLVDCDDNPVLCNMWGTAPPTLWILEVPNHSASIDMRSFPLNTTSTDAKSLTDMQASEAWKQEPLYAGYFHPFDGQLAKLGLLKPLAYAMWAFNLIPSWLLMILISFGSRTFMGNRVRNNPATAGPRRPRAGAAPT